MKQGLLTFLTIFVFCLNATAQQKFMYQGKTLTTGMSVYLVDPSRTPIEIEHVYNNVNDAIKSAQNRKIRELGTIDIYITPNVYWIDDPDDPSPRKSSTKSMPAVGMKVNLSKVRLIGLSADPHNVVLASNRGNGFGANKNFCMFYWIGEDVTAENITFGNYCSTDLVYQLKPELSRKRRTNTNVQASIGIAMGDRFYFKNCRFIGRAHMSPFVGAYRTLYENCEMECSENGLNSMAVYENCKISLYSNKPLHSTISSGVVFLNCTFYAVMREQYITRSGGSVVMVDCHWDNISVKPTYRWALKPITDQRNYIFNVTGNDNKNIEWQKEDPWFTIDMTGKKILSAFKNPNGTYNVYNLISGDDGWNPQMKNYLAVHHEPSMIVASQRNITIESEVDEYTLTTHQYYYGNNEKPENPYKVTWCVDNKEKAKLVSLRPNEDGSKCVVKGISTDDQPHTVIVTARTSSGLETACRVNLIPKQLPPPAIIGTPSIIQNGSELNLLYALKMDANLRDMSVIDWYRCRRDANGNPDTTKWYKIRCSRKEPLKNYNITEEDNGCYIMATIATKHQRCEANENIVKVVTQSPISCAEKMLSLSTDFSDIPGTTQPDIAAGLWTFTINKPEDTNEYKWAFEKKDDDVYSYEYGIDGAADIIGFNQAHRGARMMYTPMDGKYSEMDVTMEVAPCKNAGQGFSGTSMQYMDVYIKFDPATQTGYGLRIMRTKRFNSAVDFQLMHFSNGMAEELGAPISATGFRTGCTISLKIKGKLFTASVTNNTAGDPQDKGLPINAELSATIKPNKFGGFGIQHTGTVANGSCIIRNLKLDWR